MVKEDRRQESHILFTILQGSPDGALVSGSQNIPWERSGDSILLTAFGKRRVDSLY